MLLLACLNPRMAPVVLLRLAEFFHAHGLGLFAKLFSMLNVMVFGIEVSPQVQIGGGLFLPHTVGTVIGAERIGENCTIMQGVTLGTSEPDMGFTVARRPVVGDHVLIGAGAKIIGRITHRRPCQDRRQRRGAARRAGPCACRGRPGDHRGPQSRLENGST
jgi:serine O-acetyltransferase